MLLAWLFGMASGVVNACWLNVPAGHPHGAGHGEAKARPAAPLHDQDDRVPAKANCLDFCDHSAATAPSDKVSWAGLDVQALPSSPLIALVQEPPIAVRIVGFSGPPDLGGRPPITIAFLRLAL